MNIKPECKFKNFIELNSGELVQFQDGNELIWGITTGFNGELHIFTLNVKSGNFLYGIKDQYVRPPFNSKGVVSYGADYNIFLIANSFRTAPQSTLNEALIPGSIIGVRGGAMGIFVSGNYGFIDQKTGVLTGMPSETVALWSAWELRLPTGDGDQIVYCRKS